MDRNFRNRYGYLLLIARADVISVTAKVDEKSVEGVFAHHWMTTTGKKRRALAVGHGLSFSRLGSANLSQKGSLNKRLHESHAIT